jgi:D-galacturonate reductase
MLELYRQKLINRIILVDVCAQRATKALANLKTTLTRIGITNLDADVIEVLEHDNFDVDIAKKAFDMVGKGGICTIFTPDSTHTSLALDAVERGLHVMVAKPLTKTLAEHHRIIDKAKQANVLVCVEFHKRFDPIYADAINRSKQLGALSFFSSFMSQPKQQIESFRSWAGKSSDISYYLNSHHIDIVCQMFASTLSSPKKVVAVSSKGKKTLYIMRCGVVCYVNSI